MSDPFFANASGTIAPEKAMLSEILSDQGWNTYMRCVVRG
jgi:arylsulfatase A-like enzyme